MEFLNSKGGAPAANFYQLNGELLPEADIWTDMMGGTISRHRREHSPMTIGMWATAAMAVGTEDDQKAFSLEMAKFYDKDADYFGLAVDPSGLEEDTLHNEMYFEQFLGWFGTSLMTGVFSNIIDDIDNPKQNAAGLTTELSGTKPSEIPVENPNVDPAAISRTVAAPAAERKIRLVQNNGKISILRKDAENRWIEYSLNGKKLFKVQ